MITEVADGAVTVPDAAALFGGEFREVAGDLVIVHGDRVFQIPDYFRTDTPADLYSPEGALLTGETVQALAGSRAPGQYAQAGTGVAAAPIGSVETIDGTASALRTNGIRVQLSAGDPVFQGDVVETGNGSSLAIVFVDNTLFSLSADARMVLDELVYSPGGSDNSMVMNLVQGTFVFVTGQVAPTGNMQIETPVATMGIRGTTPIVQIDAINGATRFSLSPDPDGTIGSYQIFDKLSGQLIGTVSTTDQLLAISSIGSVPVEQPKSQSDLDAERVETERAFSAYQQARGGQQGQGPGGGDGNPPPGTEGQNSPPGPGGNDPGPPNGLGGGNGLPPLGGGNGPDPLGGAPLGGPGGLNLLNGPGGRPPQPPGGPQPPRPPQGGKQGNLGEDLQIKIPTQTVNVVEDTSIMLDGLSIDDPNNGQLAVTLTAFSTVTLASLAGLTFQTGDGIDDEHMVFFGPEDAVNAALQGLTYSPTPDSETGGLIIAVFDGTEWITSRVPIEITPEPDAPKVFDISLTVEEGASVTAPFVGHDPDVGDTITLNAIGAPDKGTLTQSADGTFTFDTGDAFDELAKGETAEVSFQYSAKDSTGLVSEMPATVTITVTGKNSDAEITGDLAGTATEDQASVASGVLTIKDDDTGEDRFLAQSTEGTYGDFTVAEDGKWTFTLDNSKDAVQGLGKDEVKTDTFDVQSKDESASVTVTIDVTGVNDDIEVTSSDLIGSLEEDQAEGILNDSGFISFTDPDLTDVHTVTSSVIGTTAESQLGTLSASVNTTDGKGQVSWTYSVSNDSLDYLETGENVTETFSLALTDNNGSSLARTVSVTIAGSSDETEIEGDLTGAIDEDDMSSISGSLSVKGDEGATFQVQNEALGTYGAFDLTAGGTWSYTLANEKEDVQALAEGETVTDKFTVLSDDGKNTDDVVITITGKNDGPDTVDDTPDLRAYWEEIRVNEDGTGAQTSTHSAKLADGRTAFVWQSTTDDVDNSDQSIQAAIVNSDGTYSVNEFRVNSQTANAQIEPQVIGLGDGGFAVFWMSLDGADASGYGIKARIFDSTGAETVGEFLVNTQTATDQSYPAVAKLDNGNLIVVWQSEDGVNDTDGVGVVGRILSPAGGEVVAEFRVNSIEFASQEAPSVAVLSNGNFVVTWDYSDGSRIEGRVFTEAGVPVTGDLAISQENAGTQSNPDIIGLSGGGFLAVWNSSDSTSADMFGTAIKARIFSAAGAPAGDEFLVNQTFTNDQVVPRAVQLSGGNIALTWESNDQVDDADGYSVKARIFNTSGIAVSDEILVNENTGSTQGAPDISALDDGGFIISFQSRDAVGDSDGDWSIAARIFSADGTAGRSLAKITASTKALIKVEDLTGNDSDPEDDTFSLTGVSALSAQGAAVTLNGDGTITYDPTGSVALDELNPGQEVTDTFTYTVTDENSASKTGTASVTVNGGPSITAGPDVIWSNFASKETVEVPISALLANDTDAGGSDLTFSLVSGDATISGETLYFDYPVGWDGSETLTYKVTNEDGDFKTTTVQINEFLDASESLLNGTAAAEILVGRISEDGDGSPIAANDTINGFGESDQLYGLEGTDVLKGGEGNDLLAGGLGLDDLYGEAGADTFKFSETDAVDQVLDFEVGNDKIDLQDLLDTLFAEGNKDSYITITEGVFPGGPGAQIAVDGDGADIELTPVNVAILDGITAGAVIDIVFNSNGDETTVTVAPGVST